MITVCTVIVNGNRDCLKYMLRSLVYKKSLITEHLVCNISTETPIEERSETDNGFTYTEFNLVPEGVPPGHEIGYAHALGLHACIDRASNPYLMFVDHDVIFFKRGFDAYMIDLYEQHDLWMVGVEHTLKCAAQCYLRFPTVIMALMHKSKLPPVDFLSGKLKYRDSVFTNRLEDDYPLAVDGKYLIQTPIPEISGGFPNPTGIFDVGCNLWYWLNQNNGRWLAFEHDQNLNYSTTFQTNFDLQQASTDRLLLHAGTRADRLDVLRIALDSSALYTA